MTITRRILVPLLSAALVVGACGDDSGPVSAPTEQPGRGWLGGEPEWSGASGALAEADGEMGIESAAGDASTADDGRMLEAPESPSEELAPEGAPGPLRAGSVDDNADLEGYLAYLDRLGSLGIALRALDPAGRVVVRVAGTSGLPVAGAEVVVTAAGSEVARLRTTADGTVRFHPAFHGAADEDSFDIAVGDAVVTATPGESVQIDADAPGGADEPVPVDVLFLLDATGSMSDEIDRLKTTIDSVATRLSSLESAPDLRFGMTLYRDLEDSFVTASYDFTGDVAEFQAALADVEADGGGDYPEALDEGLAEALSAPAWRDPASAVQLVFLVADAPPQVGRQVDTPYTDSVRDAMGRGVKIFPVASSESDDQAEGVFRQLAQATGARFVFLSYGAAGAATGESTDIASTDYEELALDELVVRLVAEELDALTGGETDIPVPSTTTTVPPGQ